jgi:hypothetical protein
MVTQTPMGTNLVVVLSTEEDDQHKALAKEEAYLRSAGEQEPTGRKSPIEPFHGIR